MGPIIVNCEDQIGNVGVTGVSVGGAVTGVSVGNQQQSQINTQQASLSYPQPAFLIQQITSAYTPTFTPATNPPNSKALSIDIKPVSSQGQVIVTLNFYDKCGTSTENSIPGAKVTGWDGGNNYFEGTSDSNGNLVVTGFPGVWRINATAPDYMSTTYNYPISQSETIALTLQKTPIDATANPVSPMPQPPSSLPSFGQTQNLPNPSNKNPTVTIEKGEDYLVGGGICPSDLEPGSSDSSENAQSTSNAPGYG